MTRRAGILGGTFDPVHAGHVAVAKQCRDLLGLDEVLLVPSFQPPHRPAPAAGAEDRLEMARLAAGGIPGLVVDDVEVRRGGISYAVDTVRELTRRDPGRELLLLLGQDAAVEFGSWRSPGEIGRLVRVTVFNRSGSAPVPVAALIDAGLPATTTTLTVESPAVSATEVRRRLAAGESVAGMVPAPVLEYIRAHRLFVSHK